MEWLARQKEELAKILQKQEILIELEEVRVV